MNNNARIKLKTMSIIFVISTIFFACSNADVVKREFSNFNSVSENDGIHTWLPDFFPKSAQDIIFVSHLDFNEFYIYFSLSPTDSVRFDKTLTKMDYKEGLSLLKNIESKAKFESVWCRVGTLQGEEEQTYIIGKMQNDNNRYLLTDFARSSRRKLYFNPCN